MPTREETIFAEKIKLALDNVDEPCTIKELCEHCKELSGRQDKVKKCLDFMYESGTVEHYGDGYMLSKNVTEEFRDKWLTAVCTKEEEVVKRKLPYSCYADVVKRRVSAPEGVGGACGSDSLDNKVYKRSASDIFPSSSSGMPQAAAVREGRPVAQQGSSYDNNNNSAAVSHHHHHQHEHNVVIHQHVHHHTHISDCDLSSSNTNLFQVGDKANFQFGSHNEMNFQATPKKHQKKSRRK